jgi:UDP-2,3-diacylglucosamine hydrolase
VPPWRPNYKKFTVFNLSEKKNIYLASDFHLGVPSYKKSLEREKRIIEWLDIIKKDAAEIYLVGDVFDFWFEYRHAIPKGFIRLQGKIAELTDQGIIVHLFKGNHDMWMFDYLPQELGIELHADTVTKNFFGKKYLIGHGDGIGPGDFKYKVLKKIFRNSFCQWLFARIHPNFGIGIASYFSKSSRAATGNEDSLFNGIENERLYHFCQEFIKKEPVDCFIFGHRHLPLDIQVGVSSRYINLGEWLSQNTFLKISDEGLHMFHFEAGQFYPFTTLNNR